LVPQNFLACDREQELLLPPSLREWLPEGHLAWFVLDAVDELDLTAFYSSYRADGHGRAAFDPSMMLGLLLYAYAVGERSSRQIERRCEIDVAFRVIAVNQRPDHATIARFRVRHQQAIGELFTQVLALCAKAGLVRVGVIAVDGTKLHADAADRATRTFADIAAEVLAEADAVDAAEDEAHGDARGDELPAELLEPMQRRERLRKAKQQLDAERAAAAQPVPRDRQQRLALARDRLLEDWQLERRVEAEHQRWREHGHSRDGARRMGNAAPLKPTVAEQPAGTINTTDPDSRRLKAPRGFLQGYNAQAVATAEQLIVAAEVTADTGDMSLLEPMIRTALTELDQAGVTDRPETVLADAGYWNAAHINALAADGLTPLVPPDADPAKPRPHRNDGIYKWMRSVLATEHAGDLFRRRQTMIEPIFGDLKHNRRIDRFQRRGRAACRSEWRLLAATHNLLKLYRATPGLA
jgi:transposase